MPCRSPGARCPARRARGTRMPGVSQRRAIRLRQGCGGPRRSPEGRRQAPRAGAPAARHVRGEEGTGMLRPGVPWGISVPGDQEVPAARRRATISALPFRCDSPGAHRSPLPRAAVAPGSALRRNGSRFPAPRSTFPPGLRCFVRTHADTGFLRFIQSEATLRALADTSGPKYWSGTSRGHGEPIPASTDRGRLTSGRHCATVETIARVPLTRVDAPARRCRAAARKADHSRQGCTRPHGRRRSHACRRTPPVPPLRLAPTSW
jgi:hypothetical protein